MQQIIVIHGGTTFSDYDKFLKSLSAKTVYIDRLVYKPMWKERLQEQLGDDYQVLLPSMPNKSNARYEEWKLWFDTISTVAEDDCILIGHSLGSIFLAKYLSENTFPRTIKAIVLIATPYDDESVEDLTDFKLEGISDQFITQAGRVIVINGNDDPVISLSDIQKYHDALPSAEFITLSAPDHFMRVDFPELTKLIKDL
jgi:predicted alpha/beta hydrolase family esterase